MTRHHPVLAHTTCPADTPDRTPSPHATEGLILSPSADPISHRLVQRIQSGEFVEMRDLLADNVSLHGQATFASTPTPFRPQLREVPSLTSWTYCFLAYAAVRSRDSRTRDILSYCRLLIREALRHGGNGWQEYNRSFRRQAAIDTSMQWNTLHPGLQAATLVGSGGTSGVYSHICREPDHLVTQCALAPVQQLVLLLATPMPAPMPMTSYRAPSLLTAPRRIPRPPRRPESLFGICASWNRGSCAFPKTCTYKHICGVCQFGHRGIDCPSAPEGSDYHRLRSTTRVGTAPPTRPAAPVMPTVPASGYPRGDRR